MRASLISGKRVIFPPRRQKRFLAKAKNKLNLSWPLFATRLRVHPRTLNDWKREQYSLPFHILEKICKIAHLEQPRDIKIQKPFWWTQIGGQIAGKLVYQKYGTVGGDPEYRKKKWREWWEKKGKYKSRLISTPKSIREPNFSEDLAEFTGIVMGDGGITNSQVTITLNSKTDKLYGDFIKNLLKKLFKVKPSVYVHEEDSTISIVISRVRLVKFCKSIGLKIGNKLKQNLDIPDWIQRRRIFKISCLRGLIDTDGCLFNECHRINKKKYCYPRLAFTSASKQLRFSVFKVLKGFGFMPKMRHNKDVQLENREEIIKYFKLIGTNSSNHLKRFKSFLEGSGAVVPSGPENR